MKPTEVLRNALQARIDSGVSVYRISLDAGIGNSVIARFLSSQREQIRSETLDKLAEYLDLELKPKGKK